MSEQIDLIQPVIGFRSWRCTNNRLFSTGLGKYEWLPGKNVAVCKANGITALRWLLVGAQDPRNRNHNAPGHSCDCGFYVMHTLEMAQAIGPFDESKRVYGAVAVWGNLEIHSTGIRAQYARIVALSGAGDEPQARQRLAAAYGVPLVGMEELEDAGFRYGIATPVEYVPEFETVTAWVQFHLEHPGSVGGKNIMSRPRQEIQLTMLTNATAISLPVGCRYLTLWTAAERGFLLCAWKVGSTTISQAAGVEAVLLPREAPTLSKVSKASEEKKVPEASYEHLSTSLEPFGLERVPIDPLRNSFWELGIFTFLYFPLVLGMALLYPLPIGFALLRIAMIWFVCRRIAKWCARRIA